MGSKIETAKREAALAEQYGRRIYFYEYKGDTVLKQFQSYLQTRDSAKIGRALYDFLMMREGFIAHFDIHGFRATYREPLLLLGELRARLYNGPSVYADGSHVTSVYADDMTDVQISDGLRVMTKQALPQLERAYAEGRRAADIALVHELADRHGLSVS